MSVSIRLAVISLVSAIALAAVGYTYPTLPFSESLLTKIAGYGLATFASWGVLLYWMFFQRLQHNETRFQLRTKHLPNFGRYRIATILVLGSAFASYLFGYVIAKSMYLPHQILTNETIEHQMMVKDVYPYSSGTFRRYVNVELLQVNGETNIEVLWPKTLVSASFPGGLKANSNVCVTLQKSLLGTSVLEITSCSRAN